MLTGILALEKTDWSRLHHAYGRATDTPGHLRALLDGDDDARKAALSHLNGAIMHQGTPWTATEPVALVVAGLLSDERTEPVRSHLLSFLVSVAQAPEQRSPWSMEELERLANQNLDSLIDSEDEEAIYEDEEEATNAFYAKSLLGCVRVAPILMEVMLEELADPSPRLRACAAMGAVTLAKTESLRAHAGAIGERLTALARSATDTDERSAHVLAMGDLGLSPGVFLNDPSPAVRMCAALAPGLAADSVATAELINALEHAEVMDGWFVQRPPQFCIRPRFTVVTRIVERVKEFERFVDAAEAVLRVTWGGGADFDWGPLLASAFPDGDGVVKTDAQRRFLEALLEKTEFWSPKIGSSLKWFEKAGLPYDHQLCAAKIAEHIAGKNS
ncbi:HEAT repeat domain-containing protein [Zavarzinella formosa]|uniref:hypothetical protein n=1 Tax=Zavarzinella formosa TaxID=360055 RepID=UPI0002FC0D63|nr:hypothetical protein [Zavarzinella formosa]